MNVFVTGATGFVGRKLALRLARDGHRVTAWVRDVKRAREALGAEVELVSTDVDDATLDRAIRGADAVINLAGAPVAQRWTQAAMDAMVRSRVDLTERLAASFTRVGEPPRVLVSASAVGFYGDAGERIVDESSPAGTGFLVDLCQRWEDAVAAVEEVGARAVMLRIGIVLGRDGGALPKMSVPFRLGLGASVGTGRQYMPFIHIHDLLELIVEALTNPRYRGPVNAVAPEPVPNAEFTQALAGALRRPAWFRVPAFALRLGLGRQARIVLDSQRAIPKKALALGFRFTYPTIDVALDDLVAPALEVRIDPATSPPASEYLRLRRPRHLLTTDVVLDAPIEEVFAFFAAAENLGAMTPSDMGFRILTPTPTSMERGREIRYRIRLGPATLRWTTTIERWLPVGARNKDAGFVDAQRRGPYACWYHEHEFTRVGDRTRMVDRVWYSPPFGPLGAIAHGVYVRDKLQQIFGFRGEAVALRFGIVGSSVAVAA